MAASGRHSGIRWDEINTRLAVFVQGTSVAYFDDVTADLTLQTNGLGGLAGKSVGMSDDALLALGTNDDVVIWNQSSALSAGVEVANAIVGTSVLSDIPANSLVISDITASGDIVFVARTGADSLEYFRADSSALEFVVNEASNDIDFRVEGDNGAFLLVVDAGNDRVGIGTAGSSSIALTVVGAITSSGIVSTDEWQTTGGGTVTQGTSKDTPFTLDKSAGVITLANSQLQAGVEIAMPWSNSTITANSTVVVNHAASGAGNTEDYWVGVGNVQDGSCDLLLSNLSSGALSEAVQINFVVIGGASS